MLENKRQFEGLSQAQGSFINCGPGVDTYQLRYSCSGEACGGLTQFQNVDCSPDGGTQICSNNVECPPGVSSYQSYFTFQQNQQGEFKFAVRDSKDSRVSQRQDIILPSCQRFTLTSDGTSNGTKVEDGGRADSNLCSKVQLTPTPTATKLPKQTTSTGVPLIPSPGNSAPFQSRPSKGLVFMTFLLGFAMLLPGTHAYSGQDRKAELRRRVELRVRDVSDKVKKFANNFGDELGAKVSAQGLDGRAFAFNLVADVINSVCSSYFNNKDPGRFQPTIVRDCVRTIYAGDKLAQPTSQFFAVFGASLLCDYVVSEAYPLGVEFFPDGCEGLQDLARKVTPPQYSITPSSTSPPSVTRSSTSIHPISPPPNPSSSATSRSYSLPSYSVPNYSSSSSRYTSPSSSTLLRPSTTASSSYSSTRPSTTSSSYSSTRPSTTSSSYSSTRPSTTSSSYSSTRPSTTSSSYSSTRSSTTSSSYSSTRPSTTSSSYSSTRSSTTSSSYSSTRSSTTSSSYSSTRPSTTSSSYSSTRPSTTSSSYSSTRSSTTSSASSTPSNCPYGQFSYSDYCCTKNPTQWGLDGAGNFMAWQAKYCTCTNGRRPDDPRGCFGKDCPEGYKLNKEYNQCCPTGTDWDCELNKCAPVQTSSTCPQDRPVFYDAYEACCPRYSKRADTPEWYTKNNCRCRDGSPIDPVYICKPRPSSSSAKSSSKSSSGYYVVPPATPTPSKSSTPDKYSIAPPATPTPTPCPAAFPNKCSSVCVNLKTDKNNCGVCGSVCPGSGTCNNGGCGYAVGVQQQHSSPAAAVVPTPTGYGKYIEKGLRYWT